MLKYTGWKWDHQPYYSVTSCYIVLHHVTLCYITLHCVTSHYIVLHAEHWFHWLPCQKDYGDCVPPPLSPSRLLPRAVCGGPRTEPGERILTLTPSHPPSTPSHIHILMPNQMYFITCTSFPPHTHTPLNSCPPSHPLCSSTSSGFCPSPPSCWEWLWHSTGHKRCGGDIPLCPSSPSYSNHGGTSPLSKYWTFVT